MDKKELRKKFRESRNNILNREELSKKIAKNLFDFYEYQKAESLFIFVSFRSEVNTEEIIEKSLADGKIVAIPKIYGNKMKAIRIKSLKGLERNPMGILEPKDDEEYYKIDLSLTPGLAFSKDGYRLGYGGGYYDKFFEKNDSLRVGLGFEIQKTDSLPHRSFDKKLDYLITEKEIIKFWW